MLEQIKPPLNPLWVDLDKHEQLRLHRAYERAVDSVRLWRIIAILCISGAAVFAITLTYERHQVDGKMAKAQERIAAADARVLKVLDLVKR